MYRKSIENMSLIQLFLLSAPGLAWQACLKMAAVTFELLTDIDMLLMGEKELEVEYVMHYIGVQKQIIST